MPKIENQQLQLNYILDMQSNDLVELAESTLSDEMMKKIKGNLRLGQFNNLLGVALETESPKVVKNWLLYQMGRGDRSTRPWKDSELGEQVANKDMETLLQYAESIAKNVYGDATQEQIQEVHIKLVRRYIGYLKRWFVAKGGQE